MLEIFARGNALTLKPHFQRQGVDSKQIGERRARVQGINHPHEMEWGTPELGQRLRVRQCPLRNR
jgi:hypothetical protein